MDGNRKDIAGPHRQPLQEAAFEKVAEAIATCNVPISKSPRDYDLLPSELPDTPERWIRNYAEGMASVSTLTVEDAIAGIRAAFERKYCMTPEVYAESYRIKETGFEKDRGWHRALEKSTGQEVDRSSERDIDRTR